MTASSLKALRQHYARTVRAYYAAIGAIVAGRTPEADARQAELGRLMDEARAFLWPPIPWTEVLPKIRNMQGGEAAEKEARDWLRGLYERGQRPWYGFTGPLGLAHEDPDRPETWGPRSREDIDWTGFTS